MNSNWIIVGASVTGNGHLEHGIPCQDAHGYEMLSEDFGIAVIADGAGSCENSHLGSEFVVHEALKNFKSLAQEKDLNKNNFPTNETWREWSIDSIRVIQDNLKSFAEEKQIDYKSLSCTLIVLFFSQKGILIAHVGDGRAGYCEKELQWKNAMKPYKGEQVGMTVFLTTDFLWEDECYFESRVIKEEIRAFTLLSDGCERACFECYVKLDDKEEYMDPNKPFDKFFNPNIEALIRMDEMEFSKEEMKEKWMNFLDTGNHIFEQENDDKSMILGVLKNN